MTKYIDILLIYPESKQTLSTYFSLNDAHSWAVKKHLS